MPIAPAGILNIASNVSSFTNSKPNDVILKTTLPTQSVLIGPVSVQGSPATVTVNRTDVAIIGDIVLSGNIISTATSSNISMPTINAPKISTTNKSSFAGLLITKKI